jgi:4-amino-4-deoxy-L-arabinose transferase-like glycosyltransferase
MPGFPASHQPPDPRRLRLFPENPPLLSDRTTGIILVLVVMAGATLRLWGLQFGFPHPFARPDEEVIVDVALGILSDPNPHFFDWPTLFMYLTAASYAGLFAVERAIGGTITDGTIAKASFEPVLHLIPRVWSACAGVATIVVLFAAARELFSRRVALLGAALLAVAFLHVRDSHFGVTDVPVTFLTMCAFWAGLRCATRGVTLRRVAMAGVLAGLSASTKYNAALVLLPALVAILSQTVWNRPRWVAGAVRAIAVLFLGATIAFLAGTPYAVLDHQTFITAVTGVRDHLANGHVVMARGWAYHAAFTLRYGLGIPLVVAAILGACWLIARQPWAAALVLAFPLPYYLVLGSGLTVFVRYMLPIVPFLCLTAAIFVDRLADYIGDAFKSARLRDVSTAALAAVIAIPTALPSIVFDRLMTRVDTRVIAGDWIAARFPSGASIYQNGYGYGHAQPLPRERFIQYTFNEQAKRFEQDSRPTDPPDLLILLESPLGGYSRIPPAVAAVASADYVRVITFDGIAASRAAGAVYDQDDMFFAPFGGIENASRPGPNVGIFERRARLPAK